ncbi:MAG: NAD-dependent epimerase/dehydratase family protein, partial [Actinomycetia bacterium]|nr:NAD-dependent epimerase/dehydratase family protein [Actinomycetes bacterium]
ESRNIDIVIHLSGQKMKKTIKAPCKPDNDTDFTGLANILCLAEKHRIKKFVTISCSSVYGNPGNIRALPFRETDEPKPITPSGMSNYIKEYYCGKWSELFKLKTLCIRASNIYGPGDNRNEGVISAFIENILNNKRLAIHGYGTQTRDFIYVKDFVDALYRVVTDPGCTGTLNISTNTECSINDLANILSGLYKVRRIDHKDSYKISINHSRLDNSRIKKTGWTPAHDLKNGLEQTYAWYKEQGRHKKKEDSPGTRIGKTLNSFSRQKLAYIENIIIFLVLALMKYNHLFLELYSSELAFDYSLIYIAIMGILWGQRQAYLAMLLSSVLFIGSSLLAGTDIVSFIYTPENLLRLAAYMLIGIITGYSIEKRSRDIDSKNYALKSLTKKYEFLNEVYAETRVVKDELQTQIIATEDSFGVIYSIVQEVNSLEIEKVFAASIDAIERIMKTDSVSIYTVSTNGKSDFMRLKTRSSSLKGRVPNSIDIRKYGEFKEVISSRSLVVNYKFKPDIPFIMAPVLDNKEVVAIVSLHEIPFENLTMHYENLFQTVVGLISNAVKRAYFFEASLKDKRYVSNTRILNSDTFEKVLDEVRKKEEDFGMSYSLLRISSAGPGSLQKLSDTIIENIRDNDYIGISADKIIYVLLSNTQHRYAQIVIDRLSNSGIKSSVITKGIDGI